MGTELVGFLVKGPAKIEKSREDLKELYQEMFNHHLIFNEKREDFNETALQILDEGGELYAEYSEEEFILYLESFIEFWNNPNARDTNARFDPDDPNQQIIFAGEETWGSFPEGTGYTFLRAICTMDLLDYFEIK